MKRNKLAMAVSALAVATAMAAGIGAAPGIAAPAATTPPSPASEASPGPTASEVPAATVPGASATPVAVPTAPPSDSPVAPKSPEPAPAATAASSGEKLGATMGQAGKLAPQGGAGRLAKSYAASSLPIVGDQPAGTEGKPLGLDVSGWQQNVDWPAVKKSGAQFAYIKSSEGNEAKNPYFAQQYNGSAAVGLIRGAYHFALPNVSSGAAQARVMVASGGGWSGDGITLPPALDIEDNPYVKIDKTNKCYGMSPTALVAWVKDFTGTIQAMTGKAAMIYSSYYFWQECLGGSSAFAQSNPLWIAAYYASSPWMPGQWPKHAIWQYANDYADQGQTIKATFPGDQNVFNGTMDELRELATGIQKPVLGMPAGAVAISGKWTGDKKSYVGWFKNGQWCLEMPANTRKCFYFGAAGDKPVVGDWDGDGTDTVGIVRSATWQLNNNLNKLSVDLIQTFGMASDTPIPGDWNGDGKTTPGLFRRGSWFITNSQARWPGVDTQSYYGNSTDTPLVGDWNGDRKDSFGVRRGSYFYLSDEVVRPLAIASFVFGVGTDAPTTGDWDGDRRTTVGIVRDGTWHLTNNLATLKVDSLRN